MRSNNHDCPLCGASPDDEDKLRRHLHIDHRKSELIEVLVEDVPERNRDPLPA